MGASVLKKKVKEAELSDIEVRNVAIPQIPNDADLVVSHKELTSLAMKAKPDKYHMSISSYINPPEFNDVVRVVKENNDENQKYIASSENVSIYENENTVANEVLALENIIITDQIKSRDEALKLINKHFVEGGYTTPRYLNGMLEKEKEFNTNLGNGLAIPHGSYDYKNEILKTGLVILVCKNGLRWNDEDVKLIIGIAGKGDEHLDILAKLATEFDTEEKVNDIVENKSQDEIYEILTSEV